MNIKKVLLFLLLVGSLTTYAQDSSNSNKFGQYKWIKHAIIQECNIDGVVASQSKKTLSAPGNIFHVLAYVDSTKKEFIIELVGRKKKKQRGRYTPNPIYNIYEDSSQFEGSSGEELFYMEDKNVYYSIKHFFYRIPVSMLDDYAIRDEVLRSHLSLGVLYFPFKYRPQKRNHDFVGEFNFGVAIAYTFQRLSWDKWSYSLVSGYSISNVNIDSASAGQGYEILGAVNNFTALSLSAGLLVQHEKVQIGVFVGIDVLSNKNHQALDWKYQGKPWLSIGFGLAIFSPQKKNTKTPSPSHLSTKKGVNKAIKLSETLKKASLSKAK